jgi:hypothetical protein
VVAAVIASRLFGLWGGTPVLGPTSAPDAVTVTYTTEGGAGTGWGTVNSPMKVDVKVGWSTGSQDTVLSDVTLQLLDQANQPAVFGTGVITGGLDMKPTFDIATWEWDGSVPSKPGIYHAQVQIKALYNKARDGTVDLPGPTVEARAESGPPLTGGYVFAQNANLWILSSDLSRQRRLTYFPDFYEYADQPSWAPDGKTIAFTYSPKTDPSQLPATDIWQVNPDGSNPRPLVTHQDGESLLDPSWSADGKYLYFTSDTSASTVYTNTTGSGGSGLLAGATVAVERLDLSSGKREQWMPAAQMATNNVPGGDTVYLQYVPSQNGQDGLAAPSERLMKASSGTGAPVKLADETEFQLMYAPRISPDGKWTAFAAINVPPAPPVTPSPSGSLDLFGWLGLKPQTAEAHGLPWDMYLVPSAGGQPIRLSNLNEDQPVSVWLDNSTMAFMGTYGLYKVSIDSNGNPVGQPTKMRDGVVHGGLTWHSP